VIQIVKDFQPQILYLIYRFFSYVTVYTDWRSHTARFDKEASNRSLQGKYRSNSYGSL